VLKSLAWLPESGLASDLPREKLAEVVAREDAVLWLDMEAATPQEIALLRKPFAIPAAAVDECREFTPLPKVEDFGAFLLATLHRVQFDEHSRRMSLREIEFIVARNWLVTVRQDSSTSVAEIQRRIRQNPELLREGPARLMAEIVDAITSRYFPMTEFLEREVDALETEMLDRRRKGDPFGRILALRRSVVALRRSLVPQREVIHRLARGEFKLAAAAAPQFRDVHEELYWILTELEIHRELLTSAFEGHAALAANRLGDISNRMNFVMERLTRFTTIFMPLTLITGIYGMNFDTMPELRWRWGYPLCVASLAALGGLLALYFKRTLPPVIVELEPAPLPVETRVWKRPAGPG
jgi:magnesium transporter